MLKAVARASFYVLSALAGCALLFSISIPQVAAASCDFSAPTKQEAVGASVAVGTSADAVLSGSPDASHAAACPGEPDIGAVAAIPIPAAAWLLGSALLGLLAVSRHKPASVN
jgi:hypothetical protein